MRLGIWNSRRKCLGRIGKRAQSYRKFQRAITDVPPITTNATMQLRGALRERKIKSNDVHMWKRRKIKSKKRKWIKKSLKLRCETTSWARVDCRNFKINSNPRVKCRLSVIYCIKLQNGSKDAAQMSNKSVGFSFLFIYPPTEAKGLQVY